MILQQVLATTLSQEVATYVGFNAAVSAVALQPGLASMSPDDQRSLLRVMSRTYPDISDLFTFDAAGNGVARSDDGPRVDLSGTVIYEDTLRTSRSSLAVLAWPLFSRPVFVLGAPIRETDGSLAGLVIGVVESERLATLLAAASGGASEVVYLVDGNGRVIAHPNDALVASFHDSSRVPPVAALLSQGSASGSLTYQGGQDGQDGAERRLVGWSRVPGLGWGVVVERPEAAVLASVRAGREVIFEMLLVVIGAAAVAGAISATWLAAPLVGLTSAVDRLALNDTSAPLPRSRISEVAQLASRFGELRDRLVRRTQEREQAEADLKHQATHDGLTGLPNRVHLTSSLRAEVDTARQTGLPLAFLLMDLNRFKEVNDTLGRQAGDLLLCQVGLRLRNALRRGDLVARLGGDEFALILPNTDTATAVEICRRLLDVLEQPFTLDGHQADIGGSIGIASWPLHGEDAESLMRTADVAMYVAKRTRAGCTVYAPEYDAPDPDRLTLLSELREAIESNALLLHYQPTIDMETGAVVCVDALARWQHPTRGLAPPSEFVPLMEQLGLGDRLGAWVLNRALRDLRAWNQRGLDVTVAVNLSATMLHDPGLIDTIRAALEESGTQATHLILEITESDIVVDPQRAAQALAALRDMQIRIAIDDFGTGYSSLAYIKMLSAHLIKVDRSFVAGMTTDLRDLAIVRSIIDLGRNLGLELVAEGVEDLHTWNTLTKLGCDSAQGYLISHPLPPAELVAWLENWNRQSLLPTTPAVPLGSSSSSSPSSRGQVLPLPLHRRARPDTEMCGPSGGASPVESTDSQARRMTPGRRSER